jgi:hypothetical protein
MWAAIHTEYRGGYGYSLAIIFYFACIVMLYLFSQYVVMPVVKSIRGQHAAAAISRIESAAAHKGAPKRIFLTPAG